VVTTATSRPCRPRCTDANQLPHEQTEIEAGRVVDRIGDPPGLRQSEHASDVFRPNASLASRHPDASLARDAASEVSLDAVRRAVAISGADGGRAVRAPGTS
jgi:hypothetical protein